MTEGVLEASLAVSEDDEEADEDEVEGLEERNAKVDFG